MIQTAKPESLDLRTMVIDPPLLLAPMAGLTHSAFRRLLSDFGGYGALFTEMLSGPALVREDLPSSPYTKKRDTEGKVFYQLRLNGTEPIPTIIERLSTIDLCGIDINLGCPAPEIRKVKAGAALFEDDERMKKVLDTCRKAWDGLLTIKCRLGSPAEGWEERLVKKLHIIEECGIDAITMHPRFSDEKLKRNARWKLLPFVKSHCNLPLIANGDIKNGQEVRLLTGELMCSGVMIGRMAAVKPWIFKEISSGPVAVDYQEVWHRACSYIQEDFPPTKAIGRIKEFGFYYAQNFFFGHNFHSAVQSSPDLDTLMKRADDFLGRKPRVNC